VLGGLFAAHRGQSTRRIVIIAAFLLGASLILTAVLPTQLLVTIALVPVGAMAVFFGTSANSHMQLSSALHLRGRVMAIYMLLTLGTTVVGGPFVGWVCQHFSPRFGLGLAGVATMIAAVLAALRTVSARNVRDHAGQQLATTAGG
jgi:MFS family permease